MTAHSTVALLVHGANQSDKNREKNHRTWKEALDVDDNAKRVAALLTGESNREIEDIHANNHNGRTFPAYEGWVAPWYGSVWQGVEARMAGGQEPFSHRLNESHDEASDDRASLLERIERGAMKRHFDELVPFYELAVNGDDGLTLYETICDTFLGQLMESTQGAKNFVIIAHSMGCAVSYNVLSHISCAATGKDYCPIDGTLSRSYRDKVASFASSGSRCFGLMTFGNYTGYNWCQELNNRLLYGSLKRQYVYPGSVGRWFNFWTVLGGDPYIIDDELGDDIVHDDEDRFDDVMVLRPPLSNVGHGRAKWFKRSRFSKQLYKKLAGHLYL